jgi:hypothetical protein
MAKLSPGLTSVSIFFLLIPEVSSFWLQEAKDKAASNTIEVFFIGVWFYL